MRSRSPLCELLEDTLPKIPHLLPLDSSYRNGDGEHLRTARTVRIRNIDGRVFVPDMRVGE